MQFHCIFLLHLTFVPYFYHYCLSICISIQALKNMQSSMCCISDLFEICVVFQIFHVLYCQGLNILRKIFWENFPEKLPSEVSITNLILNRDKLQLSSNNIDVLGCILPNKANEIAILSSRRFIQHPIEHWGSVHKNLVICVFIFVCVCFYLFIEQ